MNRGFLITILFLAIGVGMYEYLKPADGSGASAKAVSIDISIERRKMDPEIVSVPQNMPLSIVYRTDEAGRIVIDDYESSGTIATGRAVAVELFTSKAGLFPIYFHPASAPNQRLRAGTLEVEAPRRGW